MHDLIKKYMTNLKREDVSSFALKNNIHFNDSELDFTYEFIKKNWEAILSNPSSLQLYLYKKYYSEDNFKKLEQLINFYYQKYGYLL